MNNLLVFVLLALYVYYFAAYFIPELVASLRRGLGDLKTPQGIFDVAVNLYSLWEMWIVFAIAFALLSLFTDVVTPFEQVWQQTTYFGAASAFIKGFFWLMLIIGGNLWTLVLGVVAHQIVVVDATDGHIEVVEAWSVLHVLVALLLLTALVLILSMQAAYMWWLVTTRGRPTREFIGEPGIGLRPSNVRHWLRLLSLRFSVWFRSITLQSLICAHNEHEERFRHYMRKEWKDEDQAAPCHGKVTHGHPTLAAERRGVHFQVIKLLSRKGYQPYDISTSRRTLRAHKANEQPIPGFHGHFSPRDFQFPERNDEVTDKHAFVMIDVDYYVDMHHLASLFRPMVLYTFAPTTPCGHTSESTWSTTYVNETAVVAYNVNGGNVYSHKLWDYGHTDYVIFKHGGLGFVYAIERHRPHGTSTHMVVWLQPCVIVSDRELKSSVFERSHVVERVRQPQHVTQDGDLVTIVDNNLQFRVRASLYQIIQASVEAQKTVSSHLTKAFLDQHSEDLVEGDPQYLAEWITAKTKKGAFPNVLVYASVIKKPDGTPFKNELIDTHEVMEPAPTNSPPATATRDVSSDAGAVHTRISTIHNSVVGPERYDEYVTEFCELLAKHTGVKKGSLSPLTPDELMAKTERKKTKAKILGALETALSSADLKAVFIEGFVKREAYQKPSDERQISPTNDEHLAQIAAYAIPFKEMLCKLPNYMPGRTPAEIAEHMQLLFSCGQPLWETDFSRYDGQQSRWLRNWEVILFKYFFSDPKAAELVYNEVFRVAAKSKAGTYSTGGALCSGSSLTTIMNTAKHMLIQYITYRESGMSHEEAFARLMAAYGDDGVLTGGAEIADKMREVCDSIGLKNLKCVQAMTPERPYLTFVGRVFFPGDGVAAPSFQEPKRVWSRINLIQKGPDAFNRYLAKLACFVVTDGNSPLLGQYCRKVLSLYPAGQALLKSLNRDDSGDMIMADIVDQWILVESRAKVSQAWPNDCFPGDLFGVYAGLLGIDRATLYAAMERVSAATTVADLNNLLDLPPPPLDLRFVYKDFALSYGRTITYDNNKVTGKMTATERRGILRTTEHVLGKGSCLLSKLGTKPGETRTGNSQPRKVRFAPTGSGAPVLKTGTTNKAPKRNEQPKQHANRSSTGAKKKAESQAEAKASRRRSEQPNSGA